MKHTVVYIRAADGAMTPFADIQEASVELGRALRLRWSTAFRAARGEVPLPDPIEERRQAVKGK